MRNTSTFVRTSPQYIFIFLFNRQLYQFDLFALQNDDDECDEKLADLRSRGKFVRQWMSLHLAYYMYCVQYIIVLESEYISYQSYS